MEAFAAMIAAARTRLGLSLVEVAEKAGAGKSSLAEWEQGKRIPSAEITVRLAGILSLNPPSLLAAWTRAHLPPHLQEQVSNGHPLEQDPAAVYSAARALQARLFGWHIERQELDIVIDSKGDSVATRLYEGLRPNPDGRILRELVMRDRTLADRGTVVTGAIHVQANPGIEYDFHAESRNGYRVHTLRFPNGWQWKAGESMDFSHNLVGKGIYEPPDAQGNARSAPNFGVYGWHVVHHTNELTIRVEIPLAPARWEARAWFGAFPLEQGDNILDAPGFDSKLVASPLTAVLRVLRPLAGYCYGIVWHPPFRTPEKE